MSIVLIPFWAIQKAVDRNHGYWLTVAAPLITATTGVVVYRIGVTLGWHRVSSVIAALSFGLLTMAPAYTIELYNEPAVALSLVIALLGLLRMEAGRKSGPWLLGVSVAVACLFRYESFLLVVPIIAAVPLFVRRDRLRRHWRRWLSPILAPTTLAVAWTLWYNAYRDGDPFGFTPGGPFSTHLLDGLQRQLLSTGKGFFWYNPILVAAIPGTYLLWRRKRGVAVIIVALFLARALYFARYWNPDGSVAWGPRYLMPMCPLLALGVGEVVERTKTMARRLRVRIRLGLGALALAGALVTLSSLWVPYTYSWAFVSYVPHKGQMTVAQVKAIQRHQASRQNNQWRWSPILLNLKHLSGPSFCCSARFPLRWWRGGPSAVGTTSLLVALAGLLSATAAAAAADDNDQRKGRLTAKSTSSRGLSALQAPTPRQRAYEAQSARPSVANPGLPGGPVEPVAGPPTT